MSDFTGERRFDRDAGPVVRPYALTRGRVRSVGNDFGLIDVIATTTASAANVPGIGPEQARILDLCRRPTAVVDLASDLDLPLGVVRVLLGDLRDRGLVAVLGSPSSRREGPDIYALKTVLDGLKAL